LSDDAALALVAKQGLGNPSDHGPRAPTTISAVLSCVRATRRRGYAMISDMFAPAMASLAAPVVYRGTTLGVVTIAGPMVRMTEERMVALSDALLHTAEEVAALSLSSTLFRGRVGSH
jgi:DNA-binding IclR family transcriptional regulator